MTELGRCGAVVDRFKGGVQTCLKQAGAAACSCFAHTNITADAAVIKTCDCEFSEVLCL